VACSNSAPTLLWERRVLIVGNHPTMRGDGLFQGRREHLGPASFRLFFYFPVDQSYQAGFLNRGRPPPALVERAKKRKFGVYLGGPPPFSFVALAISFLACRGFGRPPPEKIFPFRRPPPLAGLFTGRSWIHRQVPDGRLGGFSVFGPTLSNLGNFSGRRGKLPSRIGFCRTGGSRAVGPAVLVVV